MQKTVLIVLGIHDFIKSANLGEILAKLTEETNHIPTFEEYENYVTEPIQVDHKHEVYE